VALPRQSNGHLSTEMVLRTIERLGEDAGLHEASPRQKLYRRKVTPHILRHSHVMNAPHGLRAGAHDPEAGGA